ncbi:hypothetical protein PHMEG_0005343 [Phytophthora megakarya]|uniref:Uncharacterized protein n=1 Tax=Phytophthora megakarya TaxID=4795 RepID=A0A225WT65_9STRA|nr:hypothetical protein PHMEG_0005343 [Phytophthora megakarya]
MDLALAGRYEKHQLPTRSKGSGTSLLPPEEFFRWHTHMGSLGLIHSRGTKLLCLFGSSKLLRSLRHSKIVSISGNSFKWFALRAKDLVVLNASGYQTLSAAAARSVHMRLRSSKTNQCGHATARVLYLPGHAFVCPVFGVLLLLRSRQDLPLGTPVAV